jgi:putative ABC transport system substrate-binding protein
LGGELGQKRLELLHELVPTATTIGALIHPGTPAAETQSRSLQAAARALGLQLQVQNVDTERDFDAAFATLLQPRVGGLVIGGGAFFTSRSEQLAALALHHAMPTIYQFREFAAAGGLMSYGGNNTEAYRLAGVYTGRILKGEKPAELPVQQSTKVELIVNLKTAKALGLTVPLALLTRADEVIE